MLRYPSDKTDVTGIQYEPCHIRYVGLPYSTIMPK
ncbi:TPA: D-alanyl-D-alanine carboxypeptidase family protein [Bacillus paranthracis]|nr:D-alanyl-D-alanine carboxypeptidase family protein [Bacillus paranthracis]HDR7288656.1 D-alanyl-D-alanine carboxypeptidase family protein [Bacillus paranthracis]HDR7288661.1 D-alanyl-D-alanine carboxypeptidase family protein [Bacillus paranthracis]HDR7288664.1 D-alanyl-D-alanine carboxypeptidase family protein [Bacillus paranthracis]